MDSFANTPNFLTLSRIALVPVVVYLLFLNTHLADVLAAALFIIASITDFFDGYIARKQNIVTVYGKLMDPLADKFLIVSALIMLEHLGRIHPAIVIFLICREMAITGLRALASSEGLIIPASSSAKWKTATQMVAIPMLLIDQTYFGVPLHLIGTVLIVISLIISLGSAIQFGVSVGAPYFTPFLLKKMKLSYELYMLVLAVPLLTRAISYPFHQKWMNRFGVKKVLLSCTMMIAVIPFFWTRIQGIEMFLVLQVLAGGAWAGFEYCMLIRQINDFSHSERSRVLTWTNLFVGLFTILGVCVGSMIIGPYPKFSDYTNVFTMSAVMRFFPLLLVFVMDWGAVKVSVTRIYFRMMGVRANRGSVARPILYTDEEEEKKQSTHR